MMLLYVVAMTLAAAQGARDDHFSKYFRAAGKLDGLTLHDHADFAFRTNGHRPLPKVVEKFEDTEVYNNGFVYLNFYDETACNGKIVAVSGKPTNVCLLAYENVTSSQPTGSYRYSCNQGQSFVEQFSDLNCQTSFPPLQENMYCENAIGRYASSRGFCNEDPSVLPLPSTAFVSELQYDSRTSCGANLEQFESFATGFCFKIDNTHSVKYDATNAYNYNTADCSGTATTTVLPTACTPITTYPADEFDNVAYKWAAGQVKTGLYNGPGYVWANLFQSKNCQGEVAAQEGYPTNVCLLVYANASSSDATGSKMYSCNSDTEFYQEFSDLACTQPASNYTKALTCQNIIGRFGSAQGMCNSDQSQLPIALGQNVVETLYNTAGTCETISQFNVFADDTCFHNGNKGFAYQWPNVTFYDDATCSTTPTSTQKLPQTCTPVTQFPANDPVASQWSYSDIPFPPTPAPTVQPSPMPTPEAYGAGFLYVNLYEQKSCNGPIVAVTGRPTETCLITYDPVTKEATGSAMFTCSGDISSSMVYTDTECQVLKGKTTNELGCHNILGRAGSANGVCNSDTSRLPLPASNFSTQIQYDSPTSCDGNIVQFEAYESKHCFSNGGGSSFKFDFPTEYFYMGGSCSGEPLSNTTLSQDCVASPDDDTTNPLASKWVYGDVNFGGGSNNKLSTAEIAGISAGGAVVAVGLAAAAYYFLGQGAASAAGASGATGGAVNPMVSAV